MERIIANARDTIGNGNTRQRGAIKERTLANAHDAIGDGDTRQRGAISEGLIANARDAIGDGDTRQGVAMRERRIIDKSSIFVNCARCNRRRFCTKQKQVWILIIPKIVCIIIFVAYKVIATRERRIVNARDAIGDGDTRQKAAILERMIANARDAIGDGDTRQRGAIIERITANARDAIGDGEALVGFANCIGN